jgi:hypothetical protein
MAKKSTAKPDKGRKSLRLSQRALNQLKDLRGPLGSQARDATDLEVMEIGLNQIHELWKAGKKIARIPRDSE